MNEAIQAARIRSDVLRNLIRAPREYVRDLLRKEMFSPSSISRRSSIHSPRTVADKLSAIAPRPDESHQPASEADLVSFRCIGDTPDRPSSEGMDRSPRNVASYRQ